MSQSQEWTWDHSLLTKYEQRLIGLIRETCGVNRVALRIARHASKGEAHKRVVNKVSEVNCVLIPAICAIHAAKLISCIDIKFDVIYHQF
jgi:hypothetical protein